MHPQKSGSIGTYITTAHAKAAQAIEQHIRGSHIPIYHIWAENGSNFRTQYKSIQNLRTLQGYNIFHILQHFATKFCKCTHFNMLLLAVVIYLELSIDTYSKSAIIRCFWSYLFLKKIEICLCDHKIK